MARAMWLSASTARRSASSWRAFCARAVACCASVRAASTAARRSARVGQGSSRAVTQAHHPFTPRTMSGSGPLNGPARCTGPFAGGDPHPRPDLQGGEDVTGALRRRYGGVGAFPFSLLGGFEFLVLFLQVGD